MTETKQYSRWYELAWLAVAVVCVCLTTMTALAAVVEHEFRAVWIASFASLALILGAALGIFLKHRGHLESKHIRSGMIAGLAMVALFVASMLVRSDYSIQNKDIKRYATNVPQYDASKQAGNEVLSKLEKSANGDAPLTFSIYDVCVGKISHRVHRDGPVSPERVEVLDSKALTEKIKDDVRGLGMDVVGITPLDQRFVLSKDNDGNPVQLHHKFAIVLGKGLNYRLASPIAPLPWEDQYASLPEDITAALTGRQVNGSTKYSKETVEDVRNTLEFFQDGGRAAVELAEEIRAYGYPARAHFGRWSEVQVLPVAVEAGLGEIGKNGMLINKKFGPRGSFPIVTTDLPLIPDQQEDMGMQEFCKRCNKCARACPVQAIPSGAPTLVGGLLKWPLDGQKCWDFIKGNPKCMACMGACPYNKKDLAIHRLATWLIARKSVVTDVLLVKLDDLLGYGRGAMAFKEGIQHQGAGGNAVGGGNGK